MYIRKAASPTPCESLWEALGLGEKVLKKPFHIAAVGSGGKTTLLYTLAREARERGLSVLLLPTTHMQLPERDGVLTGRAEEVIEKLKKDGFAVAGVPVGSSEIKKIGFPGWETYEKAGAFADLVLVEADGSRRLPLKYPNATEPVVPEDTDLILAVTGLSALGKDPRNSVTGRNLPWKPSPKLTHCSPLCQLASLRPDIRRSLQHSGNLSLHHRTGRPSLPRIWPSSKIWVTSSLFGAAFPPR